MLARSLRGKDDLYRRRYTEEARRFAHAIGYDYALTIGRAGLEQSRNDALAGEKGEIRSLVEELNGKRKVGDSIVTNLDAGAQQVALDALGDRRGAVVAIEPATGKVRVMASTPGYDPNALREAGVFKQLNQLDDAPLFNRATQAGYAAGLDDQGRDRGGGARQRRVHPRVDRRRRVTERRLGRAAEELLPTSSSARSR